MFLPNNFCHYSAIYSAESVSVIWAPFFCNLFCQNSLFLPKVLLSAKITLFLSQFSTSPPKTTHIQLNFCHFSPLWDHLIILQKQKLSVIFSRRNWFLCFGQKCVSVVHCATLQRNGFLQTLHSVPSSFFLSPSPSSALHSCSICGIWGAFI